MKRNKGFTISEVMVSIVILGVIGVCIINLFAYKVRIDRKSARNVKISNTVTAVFNNFSSMPDTFTIKSLYSEGFVSNGNVWTNTYYIEDENKNNYLHLTYKDENNYYILIVEVYADGKLYELNGVKSYKRKIYHGE